MNKDEILLVYDKECPACNYYCQIVRIRDSFGNLRIVDAREDTEILRKITSNGLDIDQGMVLKIGEQLYYGADAIHALSLMSSRSGLFNRLNYWVFKTKLIAKFLYPCLRFFRNILLKTLGKTKINNLNKLDNEKF